jgi:transcription initiation factor TFIID subunit 5
MLRMESASQEIDGRSLPQSNENQRPKYQAGFGMLVYLHSRIQLLIEYFADLLKVWIEDNLDLYKVGRTLPRLFFSILF